METNGVINVKYSVYASDYTIRKNLPKILASNSVLSFDTETRSVYNKQLREEATEYLKTVNTSDILYKQALMVSASSGLSFPSITRTTHFIFGESRYKSYVIVCTTPEIEMFIWKLIAEYDGKIIVHNGLFDLKIMYERVKRFPKNFEDTSLMVKCLINHVNIWKAKVGLKELMGSYYPARWALMDEYEPEDLKNPKFIEYAAIDGAATYYLAELIQEQLTENA
jgi:hypothetical protein